MAQQHPVLGGGHIIVAALAEGPRYGPLEKGSDHLGFEQSYREHQR